MTGPGGRSEQTAIGLRLAVCAALIAIVGSACAQPNRSYRIAGPSFHSAGPTAKDELQQVLDSQADDIAFSNWRRLYDLFVPTERTRCGFEEFLVSADQTFGTLRDRAEGSTITAEVSSVQVAGFRAKVDYRFMLRSIGLATAPQTARYLKLGDQWFLDEKAC